MRYFVIAKKYDDDKKAQIKYIAEEFDSFPCAKIFKDAYNEYYKADACIVDQSKLY